MKHTTVRKDFTFNISDPKGTIEGFSMYYFKHQKNNHKTLLSSHISFTIVTNRLINKIFKEYVANFTNGDKVNLQFSETLEKYA
jgi:hypothetical protein